MKYILSFGAGLNSSAMLVYLYENKQPIDEVVFSDTGDEFPETYQAVEYYQSYCKEKEITFTWIKKESTLYEFCLDKKIIPTRIRRQCTSRFKIEPIRKYLREKYGKEEKFRMYIGISYEECHRIRTSDVGYIENRYPLVDARIDRDDCTNLLRARSFLVPRKSGCFYCPFTKKQGWLDLRDKYPTLFEKSVRLEENGRRFPEMLLSSIPLRKLREQKQSQKELQDFEPSCDVSGSCFL